MNVEKLQNYLRDFAKQRDWEKFHNPKNISMALSVEASELLEVFQWLSEKEASNLSKDQIACVSDEIADVVLYSILLCEKLSLNLEEIIWDKTKKNEKKYPVKR